MGICIGDSGAQIVDLLKKNPGVAIQVVLARLNQKDEEWRKVKQEMKPLFSKVFQQNYHKSLDHRSFYFKQTDKKQLGHKAMIQVSYTPALLMLTPEVCGSLLGDDRTGKLDLAVFSL